MNLALMIHGAGGGGWEWRVWKRVFESKGWTVITQDLEPVGNLESTTLSDYFNQVVKMVSLPLPENLVIIGASMGGMLALMVAERFELTALVLVNSVPPKGVGHVVFNNYPAVVRWANQPMEDSARSMPDCDQEAIYFAASRWRDESGAVLNELSAGVTVSIPSCKALVIAGSEDVDVPVETAYALARWANADLHIYSGMSHVGPLLGRKTEEVATQTLAWLRSQANV